MQLEFASTGLASTGDWARDRELESAAVRRVDIKVGKRKNGSLKVASDSTYYDPDLTCRRSKT
jgi:hypothetical protein